MAFERCLPTDGAERWRWSDGGVAATIVPAAGMNLVSFEVDGADRVSLPLVLDEFLATEKTGGVPLLHPWANRLRGDRWRFDGIEVDLGGVSGIKRDGGGLPMHGLVLRARDWAVSPIGDDAVEGVLAWRDGHPMFPAFPFPHRVSVRWTISTMGDLASATCRFAVQATDRDVPIAGGWHPYLRPLAGRSSRDLGLSLPPARHATLDAAGLPVRHASGAIEVDAPADLDGPIGDRRFDDLFEVGGDGWTAAVTGDDVRVSITADPAWRWMQVFTPADSDAVCIEPMLAPTAALSDGAAVRVPAGERFEASFTVAVTRGAVD